MPSTDYTHRNCPGCSATPPAALEVHSGIRAENLPFSELGPYWNGFFQEKIFFSYVRCPVCSLVYAPIFFKKEQLAELYSQMPANMDVVPNAALVRTQYEYFKCLRRYSSGTGEYIEIGPDIGLLTKFCASESAYSKYWLFEPNRSVREQLTASVNQKQFEIIETIENFDCVPDETAGALVMVHVLDHLLDPVETLKSLRRKLSDGAAVIIVTHNEQSYLRRLTRSMWPAYCLQHPQIYNRRSITNVLEAAGYTVTKISRTKNYFELSFLIKHLLWAFGIKVTSVPKFLDRVVGLKLGNIITAAKVNKK
jgi:hypothetical protein